MIDKNAGRLAGRYLRALAIAGRNDDALQGFLEGARWTDGMQIRSAVAASVVGDWTNTPLAGISASFIELARPQSLIGRWLEQGIVRAVPDHTPMLEQTSGARAQWVAEGDAVGVSNQVFSRKSRMDLKRVAAISVATRELVEQPHSELLIVRDLAAAVADEIDSAAFDGAGGTGARPASLLYGATTTAATGATITALHEDLAPMVAEFPGRLDRAAWVAHPKLAAQLSLLERPIGHSLIRADGGGSWLLGLPFYVSAGMPTGTAGSWLALIDLGRIEIAGLVTGEVEVATEASILMDDDPSMDATTPTGAATAVSLWQSNSVGFMGSALANWRIAANSALVLTGAQYGVE